MSDFLSSFDLPVAQWHSGYYNEITRVAPAYAQSTTTGNIDGVVNFGSCDSLQSKSDSVSNGRPPRALLSGSSRPTELGRVVTTGSSYSFADEMCSTNENGTDPYSTHPPPTKSTLKAMDNVISQTSTPNTTDATRRGLSWSIEQNRHKYNIFC